MKQRGETGASLPRPLGLFLMVLAVVFLAEGVVMFLLPALLPGGNRLATAITDAALLTLLILPFLWWVIVRPLHRTTGTEQARATSVLLTSRDAIILINEQGLVELFNPAAARMFGYTEEEVVGKSLTMLMPERYRDRHQNGVERLRRTGESKIIGTTLEAYGLRKDGTEFPLEISVTTWSTQRETFHTGVVRDITEHKRAEEALREATDTLRAIIQASPLAILALDPGGNVQMWNRAAERIFGWSEQEVLGRPAPFVPSERQTESQALRERVLHGEAFSGVEVRRQRRDGSPVDTSLSTAPLRDANGVITGIMAVLADITEHKRAEERLRLQGTALESAANAILITDREGRITWVNPAFTRLTGYTLEEALGQNPRLLKSGKHGQAFYGTLWETILSGQTWHMEMVNRRKDGSLYVSDQTISPVRDASGTISHFVTIQHDITDRKRAEEALARSEQQFRELVQSVDAIVWEADPATFQFTFVSDRAEAILGYPVAQWLAEPDFWVKHLHPDDREQAVAFCAAATAEGRDHDFEYRMLAADGRIVWLRDRVRVITDKAGRVRQLRGLMGDITERKRAEEIRQAVYEATREIQTSQSIEDRLARFLLTARDVLHLDRVTVLLADPGGQWLQAVASLGTDDPLGAIRVPIGPDGGGLAQAYQNQEAVVWDGRAPVPEALRLQPPHDRIAALRSRVFAIVPLVVQGRTIGVLGADRKHSRQPIEPGTLDLLHLFASHAAPAIEHARLYEELRRSAIHLEARVEDRTRELQAANLKLEEALKQVEEASRHKSEFLSNMSHEFRTPLNSILGFSQFLREQAIGPLTEKQARYINHIHNSGQHLLALINDLLDLSKVEAGKLELRPEPFEVREALAATLREVQPQAEAKSLVLDLQVDEGIPSLTADPVRSKQILLNLLSNAVKFTPEGGRVTVTARLVEGAFVEIAVLDTGLGIKPGDLPKLFQPFSQLEAAYTKRHEGTGLGLALTKRLVELHGGTIWAESEGEGCGTIFTVRLPLIPPPPPPNRRTRHCQASGFPLEWPTP